MKPDHLTSEEYRAWLAVNGGVGVDTPQLEYTMLTTQGAPELELNDMWMYVLGTLGYEGNLSDRLEQFWDGGGNFFVYVRADGTATQWEDATSPDDPSTSLSLQTLYNESIAGALNGKTIALSDQGGVYDTFPDRADTTYVSQIYLAENVRYCNVPGESPELYVKNSTGTGGIAGRVPHNILGSRTSDGVDYPAIDNIDYSTVYVNTPGAINLRTVSQANIEIHGTCGQVVANGFGNTYGIQISGVTILQNHTEGAAKAGDGTGGSSNDALSTSGQSEAEFHNITIYDVYNKENPMHNTASSQAFTSHGTSFFKANDCISNRIAQYAVPVGTSYMELNRCHAQNIQGFVFSCNSTDVGGPTLIVNDAEIYIYDKITGDTFYAMRNNTGSACSLWSGNSGTRYGDAIINNCDIYAKYQQSAIGHGDLICDNGAPSTTSLSISNHSWLDNEDLVGCTVTRQSDGATAQITANDTLGNITTTAISSGSWTSGDVVDITVLSGWRTDSVTGSDITFTFNSCNIYVGEHNNRCNSQLSEGASMTFNDCVFEHTTTSSTGVRWRALAGSTASLQFNRCEFDFIGSASSNSAWLQLDNGVDLEPGSGLFSCVIYNMPHNAWYENYTTTPSGLGNWKTENCTIEGGGAVNRMEDYPDAGNTDGYLEYENCAFVEFTSNFFMNGGGTSTTLNCAFYNTDDSQTTNTNVVLPTNETELGFEDLSGRDFRLTKDSMLLLAGNPSGPTNDILGSAYKDAPTRSIGAYEHTLTTEYEMQFSTSTYQQDGRSVGGLWESNNTSPLIRGYATDGFTGLADYGGAFGPVPIAQNFVADRVLFIYWIDAVVNTSDEAVIWIPDPDNAADYLKSNYGASDVPGFSRAITSTIAVPDFFPVGAGYWGVRDITTIANYVFASSNWEEDDYLKVEWGFRPDGLQEYNTGAAGVSSVNNPSKLIIFKD